MEVSPYKVKTNTTSTMFSTLPFNRYLANEGQYEILIGGIESHAGDNPPDDV